MSFLGLRKWPTPVAKPMWPFIAAGTITFLLVSKAQEIGVKCTSCSSQRSPRMD
ncbi:hypothetical protein AcW2_005040 [Taiwanofungus camphoratus]|nr:hypothetical protein AcW2_005040 [Antrodia cinnamomea]